MERANLGATMEEVGMVIAGEHQHARLSTTIREGNVR